MTNVHVARGGAGTAALLLVGLFGCQQAPPAPSSSEAHAHSVDVSASQSGWDELHALDPRTPVPLMPQMAWHQKQNMQDHLQVVQEVLAAVAKDDLDSAARAASRMGLSDSMQQQCEHMGQGAPGFTERALAFHRQADLVANAARAGDRDAVLRELSSTLTMCTSCHASYKQEVVSREQWSARSHPSSTGSESSSTSRAVHGDN